MNILYTAEALASGDGRNGRGLSSDGKLDVALAVPKEMGGSGNGTNPEQLFAAGYAACFHSALRIVAKTAGADTTGSTVGAQVSMGRTEGGAFGLSVKLSISLPEVAHHEATVLAQEAHLVCPYSNAVRDNIDVEIVIA